MQFKVVPHEEAQRIKAKNNNLTQKALDSLAYTPFDFKPLDDFLKHQPISNFFYENELEKVKELKREKERQRQLEIIQNIRNSQ